MTLASNISALAAAIGADIKALNTNVTTTSSTTSNTLTTGSKSFVLASAKTVFLAGTVVRIWETSVPANYMVGVVTSLAGTALTVNVTEAGGNLTLAITDWSLSLGAFKTSYAPVLPDGVSRVLKVKPIVQEVWGGAASAAIPPTWTSVIPTGGAAIQSGAGTATLTAPGNNQYLSTELWRNDVNAVDMEVTGAFAVSEVDEMYTFLSIRDDGSALWPNSSNLVSDVPQSGYSFMFYGGAAGFTVLDGAAANNANYPSTLGTNTTFPAIVAATKYNFRIISYQNGLYFKIWLASATEPLAWTWSTTTLATKQVTGGFRIATKAGYAATNQVMTVYPITIKPRIQFPDTNLDATSTAMPPVGTTVYSKNRVFTSDLGQDFLTNAAVGAVRAAYPSMGYFTPGQADTANSTTGGIYDPDQSLSVANSVLTIAQKTAVPSASAQANGAGTAAVPIGACVMPDNYQARTYGRWSLRFLTTNTGVGYKFVMIGWPVDNVWNEGEIDWPEADLPNIPRPASAVPGSFNSSVGAMLFQPQTVFPAPTDMSAYHIASVEWTPDGISFYWDGVQIGPTLTSGIPTTPMRIELQAETYINEGTVPPASVGTVQVDWVAAYQLVA